MRTKTLGNLFILGSIVGAILVLNRLFHVITINIVWIDHLIAGFVCPIIIYFLFIGMFYSFGKIDDKTKENSDFGGILGYAFGEILVWKLILSPYLYPGDVVGYHILFDIIGVGLAGWWLDLLHEQEAINSSKRVKPTA